MKHTPRRLAVLAIGIAAAIGLAGCGTPSGPSNQPTALTTENVTISLFWWGNDARQQRTQQVIDLFQKKYPNIKVEPQFADWTSYWDKLATMTAGSNMPDVVQMDMMYLASYAGNGVLANLDGNPLIDTKNIPSAVLGTGLYKSHQYGMPISATAQALIVNTTLLDQLGIALPDTSKWTWDEFNTWAASITKASNGTIYGTYIQYIEYQLELFARQMNDTVFKDGKMAIKPETLAKFFQTSLDWVNSGAAPSASTIAETINVPIDQSPFGQGKEVSAWGSSTQITSFQAAVANSKMVVAELPRFADAPSGWEYLKPGMYWSMSAKSAHPAEAAALINFLINDPEAGAIIGAERGIPASTAIMNAIKPSLKDTEQKAVEFGAGLTLGPAPEMPPAGSSDVQNTIQRYLLVVLNGQQTPLDAAKAMIAEVNAAIQAAK